MLFRKHGENGFSRVGRAQMVMRQSAIYIYIYIYIYIFLHIYICKCNVVLFSSPMVTQSPATSAISVQTGMHSDQFVKSYFRLRSRGQTAKGTNKSPSADFHRFSLKPSFHYVPSALFTNTNYIQGNPKYGCKGTVTTRFALIALVAWQY